MSEVHFAVQSLAEDAELCWRDLQRRGLERNIAELAVLGYTVVTPEQVAGGEDVTIARDELIALAKAAGAESTDFTTYEEGLSFELYHLVKQGRVFERWLLNPTILALGRYLLGARMILNNSLGYVKAKTDKYLAVHSDSLMVPDPLPEYLHLVNFTIALTDYTLEGGCIGIVPGSHRLRRHPSAAEERLYAAMKPIECPAGSVIVIPGNTWHGAFPKSNSGLRVTLVQAYSRQYFTPSVTHRIDEEIINRNPPEFAQLLGRKLFTNFDEKGLNLDNFAHAYMSQKSHYA